MTDPRATKKIYDLAGWLFLIIGLVLLIIIKTQIIQINANLLSGMLVWILISLVFLISIIFSLIQLFKQFTLTSIFCFAISGIIFLVTCTILIENIMILVIVH